MRLADRIAIVTGAGSGIGRAIALGFAREGANVVAADLNLEGAERTAEEARALHRGAIAVAVDVAQRTQVEAMVTRAVAEFGRVDVLVSNAGISHRDDFLELPEESWERVIGVNLKGVYLCGQAAGREMARTGGGSIINITSQRAETPDRGKAAYTASKGGVKSLTKAMAVDLAPHRIRVNAIGPGPTWTALTREKDKDPTYRERILRRVPLGRMGEPEDMVGAAVFFASDESSWVTGQCLFVDGGWLACARNGGKTMPDYDLIVRGGLVAMPRVGMVQADIGVKDGRVRAVGLDLPGSAAETLEAGGLWVFPGLVDPHTHMGNMNPFQEDLATETRSAAFGGVTTIITTLRRGQFTDPLRPYPEFFHQALTSLEGLPSMDWAVHFTTSRSGPPEDYQACYEQLGAQSVKAYLAYKTRAYDPGFGTDDLLRFLQVVATMRHRPLIMVHAEDEDLARVTSEVARAAGLDGIAAWNAARPNFCENVSIHTVCELARHTGVTVYIVHVTTKEGIALIAEEQRRGAPVIAETNVQYLTLTTGMGGVEGKINPPIREQADVDALWRHLEEGTVHTVGSDHVARPASTKEGTIWDASLGFPGAETLLPMLLTGFRQRSLPVERIADLCSLNVARTFGLYPRKGHLSVGADADMVLVDPDQRRVIRAAELHSVARHTPYEGMEAHGWPVATVLRGRVIVKDGQLAGEPSGRFVPVFPGGPGN